MTARGMPASAAARFDAPVAKNAAQSANSGATVASSAHTLVSRCRRRGSGRAHAASTAAAARSAARWAVA